MSIEIIDDDLEISQDQFAEQSSGLTSAILEQNILHPIPSKFYSSVTPLSEQYDAVPFRLLDTPIVGCCYRIAEDGGVVKTVLSSVLTTEHAPVLSRVYVNVEGRSGSDTGPVFLTSLHEEVDFVLGRAEVAKGLEMSVSTMCVGEWALVRLSEKYGYPENRRPIGCPPNTTLVFRVQLLRYEVERNGWDMSTDEKLDDASKKRDIGNRLFSEQKYKSAEQQYDKALNSINNIDEKSCDISLAFPIMLPLLLNASACKLRSGDLLKVITYCTKALEIDHSSVKALFRRCQAHRRRQDFDDALADLERAKVIQLQSTCGDAIHLDLLRAIETERRQIMRGQHDTRIHQQNSSFAGFLDRHANLLDTDATEHPGLWLWIKQCLCCSRKTKPKTR